MKTSDFATRHITGEGFRRVTTYRHFFRAALRTIRAAHAAYEAEVKDWYENGDGRPREAGGRGYTFPHCIHGVSRWVDYDCACGWCEEGSNVVDEARLLARERFLRFNQRWEWLCDAPGDVPTETRRTLQDWVFEAWLTDPA